jgi:diacylglycerol kinase family enzyme
MEHQSNYQSTVTYISADDGEHYEVDGRNVVGITSAGKILKVEKGVGEAETDRLPTFVAVSGSEISADSKAAFKITLPTPSSTDGTDFPKIHIVVSTLSGTQLAVPFFKNVLRPVLEALQLQVHYELNYTKDTNSITQLTEDIFLSDANDGIPQLIILLSGDGGIVDILNSLLSQPQSENYLPPEIALIPMGTGNALAHSSGIASDNTFGLSTLVRGRSKDLPLLCVTFSPGARLLVDEGQKEEELPLRDQQNQPVMFGAVVCSWGAHAGLVADSDTSEYRKFGVKRFAMAAKEALYPADGSEPHRYKARLSLLPKGASDWIELDRTEHTYVLSTLVSNLESGFVISPDSKPLQGGLRIIHFGPMTGDEVMRIMNLAYQGGKHVHEGAVAYEEVDGIRISFEGRENDSRWRRICVDGKIVRVEADGWIEVRRATQKVLTLRYLK